MTSISTIYQDGQLTNPRVVLECELDFTGLRTFMFNYTAPGSPQRGSLPPEVLQQYKDCGHLSIFVEKNLTLSKNLCNFVRCCLTDKHKEEIKRITLEIQDIENTILDKDFIQDVEFYKNINIVFHVNTEVEAKVLTQVYDDVDLKSSLFWIKTRVTDLNDFDNKILLGNKFTEIVGDQVIVMPEYYGKKNPTFYGQDIMKRLHLANPDLRIMPPVHFLMDII